MLLDAVVVYPENFFKRKRGSLLNANRQVVDKFL
jgi:hypothetical protein